MNRTLRRKHGRGAALALSLLLHLPLLALWPGQAAAASDDWFASARAFLKYDNNVPLASEAQPDSAEEGSTSGGLAVAGGRRVYNSDDTQVYVGLGATGLKQFKDSVDDFDVITLAPFASLRHQLAFGAIPAQFTGSLSGARTWLGGDGFNGSVTGSGGLQFWVAAPLSIGPSVSIGYQGFDSEGGNDDVFSRDATRINIALNANYIVFKTATLLDFSIGYTGNVAEGDNFDHGTILLGGGLSQPFLSPIGPMTANLRMHYGFKDHRNFRGSPNRDQNIVTVAGGLVWAVHENVGIDAGLTYRKNASNRAEFDYDRLAITAGATWRY